MDNHKDDLLDMVGRTFSSVKQLDDDELVFTDATTGEEFVFSHMQDCCESVQIEDIVGDLSNLVGAPLLVAEERTNKTDPPAWRNVSYTWTYYTFRTIKGTVDVRWFGMSNGYYSESVEVFKRGGDLTPTGDTNE